MKPQAKNKQIQKNKFQHRSPLKGNKGRKMQSNKGKQYLDKIKKQNFENNKRQYRQIQRALGQLNLPQYGFDNGQSFKNLQQIQNLLEKFLQESNLEKQQIQWKKIVKQNIIQLKKQSFIIARKGQYFFWEDQSHKLIEIEKSKSIILSGIYDILNKIIYKSQIKDVVEIVQQQVSSIKDKLNECLKRHETFKQTQKWTEIQDLKDQLIKQISYRTFLQGLKDQIINQYNYFLMKEIQQKHKSQTNSQNITNQLQWVQFIGKKRVKSRKANKFILHTACQLCLSPHTEESNMMINCPQCHARGHQACLSLKKIKRCGRCVYLRLSNKVKQKVPECFICGMKGFVPLKISSSKFVHVFCIMVHNIWEILRGKINLIKSQDNSATPQQMCKYCLSYSNYCTNCQKCSQPFHYLCFFMEGGYFRVDQNKQIKVSCCQINEQSAKKLSMQRKYILNYDNFVYKKFKQVIKQKKIQKSKGRYRNKIRTNQKLKPQAGQNKQQSDKYQIALSEDEYRLEDLEENMMEQKIIERRKRKHYLEQQYANQLDQQ